MEIVVLFIYAPAVFLCELRNKQIHGSDLNTPPLMRYRGHFSPVALHGNGQWLATQRTQVSCPRAYLISEATRERIMTLRKVLRRCRKDRDETARS
jgi:hypothetical protein